MVRLQTSSLPKGLELLMLRRAKERNPHANLKAPRRLVDICLIIHPICLQITQKEPLPSTFACLFCNHESSVTVKMDKKGGTGELSCKICGQQFQTGINCIPFEIIGFRTSLSISNRSFGRSGCLLRLDRCV